VRAAGSVPTLRVAALIGLVLAVACGGTNPGGDLAPGGDATDAGRDAAADLADGFDAPDFALDTPDRDLPGSPDDGIAPGDDSGVPADPGDPGDPGSADQAADPASLDAPDDRDADLADPGPPCDPAAGPCPCATPDDCPAGAFCDGTECRPWICIPDARFCQGTTLLQCAVDGGGETIVEDCDDGDPCTLGDGCSGTRCRERTAVSCDDGNPCTSDACERATGACVSTPVDGTSCTDDDPCTANDRCKGGLCVAGGATPCSDGNPCTTDFCTSLLGCVHEPAAGSCTPASDPCAAGRECRDAACQIVPRDCDDDDPCTLDACQAGACTHTPVAGCACELAAGCDDGNACSQDACVGGRCVHEAAPAIGCCQAAVDCDDNDPCSLDDCRGFRCTHAPAPLPACCSSPRLDVAFDDGTVGGFVLEPAGPDGVGWRRAATPEGGGFVLAFSNAATTGYGTGARVAGTALSPPVTLPAGVALSVTFRTWQDVESAPGQDPFRVDALSPDGTATPVWTRPEGFPMRAWRTVTANASALGGRTVRLRFAFDSLDGTANDGRGVFLDDIAVTSTCAASGCGLESDCTSLDWHATCLDGVCDYTRVLDVVATPGAGNSAVRFAGPSDVAVSPDGTRAYVSDRDAHRVQVLDADGNAGPVIGSYGTAPGKLVYPRGVAADADRVYVADSGNNRIQAFSPAGTFLWSFGSKGDAPGRFNEPKGLALSDDGDTLWVADTGNHRVQGLTRWGVVRVVIGGYGRLDGQFRSPSCVVPLPDGGIVVCDTQNNRLQRFAAGGRHRATITATDGVPLSQPYGAARAEGDALWVSDTYNHRIILLDASGRTRDVYGQFGDGPGRFAYPLGMETDASGRLWVVDSGNKRVVVLRRGPVP
jgi:DNA-binding beta-propeller fold protein YncE